MPPSINRESLSITVYPLPTNEQLQKQPSFWERLAVQPHLHCLLLTVIVWTCFGRTLGSYFLADDFSEIAYAQRICQGASGLFWSNFTGNYMQVPGMSVWRPWLLVSLVSDCLLWRANACGYYLSNLLYFTGDVLIFYLLVRRLTAAWTGRRSALTALSAALLFAVSPLHCESISWVVGRVDIISCFFYLLAFYLTQLRLRRRDFLATASAVIFFWLSLWTKEMAIGLPVLVTGFGLLWAEVDERSGEKQLGFRSRLRSAWQLGSPLWGATAVYFALRYLVLGTLVGGYTAGFGAAQLAGMAERWLDPDTLTRLALPLSQALFRGTSIYATILTYCYVILSSIICVRLISGQLSLRWLSFLLIWAASAAVPIFQLWGLGYDLEGSRFYFFLSLPLSLLIPALVFQPASAGHYASPESNLNNRLSIVAALVLFLVAAVFYRAAYATNLLWVHAGKEVRRLSEAAQALVSSAPPDRKFLVLGIPNSRGGAHLILNSPTFDTMLRPPFTKQDISDRFLVFDPVMFGPAEYIDATRFKSCLSSPGVQGPLVWSGPDDGFVRVPLAIAGHEAVSRLPLSLLGSGTGCQPYSSGHAVCQATSGLVELDHVEEGDGLRFAALSIDPLTVDFLELELSTVGGAGRKLLTVAWQGDRSSSLAVANRGRFGSEENQATMELPACRSGEFERVRIRLSHYWRWYTTGKISALALQFSPCDQIRIRNIALVADRSLAPSLALAGLAPASNGIYTMTSAPRLVLSRVGSENTDQVQIEVTKPNFFLDNFPSTGQDQGIAHRLRAAGKVVELSPDWFSAPGYYQIRARCLGASGEPAGEYSDPLTVKKP